MVKESDFENNICLESNKFLISESSEILENFLFDLDKNTDIDFNTYFNLDRLPPLNLDFDKINNICNKIDFIQLINLINSFFEFCLEKFPKAKNEFKEKINNLNFIRMNFYIYYISLKLLIVVSLHEGFGYSEITRGCIKVFFEKFLNIKSNFKYFLSIYKNGYLLPKAVKKQTFLEKENTKSNAANKHSFDNSNSYILDNYFSNFIKIDNPNSNQINNNNNNNTSNRSEENKINGKENNSENENNNFTGKDNILNNPKNSSEELNSEDSISKTDITNSMHIKDIKDKKDLNQLNPKDKYLSEKEYQKQAYLNNLSKLYYNTSEENCIKLLIKNSNFYEMGRLSKGFFDPYSIFISQFHLIPFIDFLTNKEKFLNIIHNYQNFLLFVIMMNAEEHINRYKLININISFMPIFEILYKVNETLKLIEPTEFYNDFINRNVKVDFVLECKNYLKYISNEDKYKFCWLKYYWVFDARAKSDTLCVYNNISQQEEFLSQIQNIGNQMLLNPIHPYLIMKINRNEIIEDSLNFLVNHQINFKKQLKVKFIGEQGIDEGGVKKEYFLLLVRQIFNPEYSMFTYSDKTRFFWFNPFSFESKIKYELIGIIFGLAFYNNVILDVKFPLVVYKKLLNIKPTLNDLEEIDEELYRSYVFLLTTKERNLKEVLGTTFTAVSDSFGEKQIFPLKVKIKFKNFLRISIKHNYNNN